MGQKKKPDGYIELKFGPRWKYIACARGFIQNFIAISIEDQAKADKVAMAASELLENAVKYACGEDTYITIRVSPETKKIHITVENQADKEHIETLKKILQAIKQGDPLKVYVAQMKEAALRSDGKSQLGLSRIRYETGGELKYNVVNNKVVISILIE